MSDSSVHIGIAGPIASASLQPFLDPCDDLPDGLGGISVTQLVYGLVEAGHRVSVFTLDRSVTRPVVSAGPRLTIYFGPFRNHHRMRDGMKVERTALYDFITAARPDVVHAHWTYEYALAALRTGVPTLITVRDWAPTILRMHPDLYRAGRFLLNLATLVKGEHFVANSPYLQRLVERYTRRPVPVIPNGLADMHFTAPRTHPRGVAPIIVSVNNGVDGRKNILALIEAFALMRDHRPACRLRLIGAGSEPNGRVQQRAEAEGLPMTNVTMCGSMPHAEVLSEMARADVLVHPALEESFGMTLIEAMAKGTPVVGGRTSGAVPWVLNEGRAGVLTDVHSPQAMADATLNVLGDADHWRHLSAAGYHHAYDAFRLSRIVQQHVDLYHALLDQSNAVLHA